MHHHRTGNNEYYSAALFLLFIVTVFFGSVFSAFMTSGPIVLGTELNTNGLVEYLCLGMGCDALPY